MDRQLELVPIAAFLDEFEKIAINKVTKFLLKNPAAVKGTLARMTPEAASQTSYKVLGNKARQAVQTSMPEGAGHGAGHVWDVTKDTQRLMGGRTYATPTTGAPPATRAQRNALGSRPLDVTGANAPAPVRQAPANTNVPPTTATGLPVSDYRRATLGSLLHDIGRPAEGRVLGGLQEQYGAKAGKKIFGTKPYQGMQHSELGGRYADNFVRTNPALVQNVPGLDRGQLKGAIRAHDTDMHSAMPWTAQRLNKDPAAAAVYLGDKSQGLGRVGKDRTIETGAHFKEAPQDTVNYAINKNVPKYHTAIEKYAPTPEAASHLHGQLREYHQGMADWGRAQGVQVPQVNIPGYQASVQRTAMPIQKAASVEKYERLFKRIATGPAVKQKVIDRALRMIGHKNNMAGGQAFAAMFKMPVEHRAKLRKIVFGK